MKKIATLAALLLAASLLNAATVVSPPAASAESGIVHYATGNRPAFMDVTKLRATNAKKRIRVALHVRDLRHRGRFLLGLDYEDYDFAFGFYAKVRHTDSGLAVKYRRWKQGNDIDPVWRCARAEVVWRPAHDRIILTAPHRCLRYYDYYKVVDRWAFGAWGSGMVDGRERFDSPGRPLVLDRG